MTRLADRPVSPPRPSRDGPAAVPPPRRPRRPRVSRIVLNAVLVVASLVMLYPIIVMVLTSVKSNQEVYQNPIGMPQNIDLGNYASSWQTAHFDLLFMNSVIFTVSSMAAATLLSALASYALVTKVGRMPSAVYLFIIAGFFLRIQLAIVPQFRVLKDFGLVGGYLGVIIVYVSTSIPFGVFLIAAFMRQVPKEIREAATIDGAGFFTVFWRIYFPLARPAIASFWILQGVAIWNDFLIPLVLISDADKRPLTTGVLFFKQAYTAQWGNIMAGVVMMILPILILYIVAQKSFLRGLYAGAVK